jgi:hypothetical protein
MYRTALSFTGRNRKVPEIAPSVSTHTSTADWPKG